MTTALEAARTALKSSRDITARYQRAIAGRTLPGVGEANTVSVGTLTDIVATRAVGVGAEEVGRRVSLGNAEAHASDLDAGPRLSASQGDDSDAGSVETTVAVPRVQASVACAGDSASSPPTPASAVQTRSGQHSRHTSEEGLPAGISESPDLRVQHHDVEMNAPDHSKAALLAREAVKAHHGEVAGCICPVCGEANFEFMVWHVHACARPS